ncbi:hypothetical protein [Nocardia wallacei]|uniref:hypothetical protein n=1 Tax=Nocardia wallacei TaxID=480035 RepID=UPI002454B1B1|nr:hypothetical protein [Nocardia wallacei]
MTSEIAVPADQYAPAIGTGLTAGAALGVLDLYADAIDKAYGFAEKLCRTPLVGNVYRGKPADAAVAILYGAELGLNPIQSLQNVFTVHGTPAIYARTMVAMLQKRGYRIDPIESSDESVTVTGYSSDGREVTSTWTIERATKAGYVPQVDENTGEFRRNSNGKLIGNEKYLTDPQAMLYAKAAAEVCRKLAPDVLLGISSTREDLESEPAPGPVRVTSERMYTDRVSDAEVADAMPPKVQQWEPPAEAASNPSPKPETPQVEDTAETPPEPVVEMATTAEQRALSAELDRHSYKTPAAKRKWLSTDTGREIASAKELTGAEARGIVERLTPREAGDMPIPAAQWAHAAQMLDQLTADTDEKKLLFLRSFLPDRAEITNPLDLNEREGAEVVAELTQLLADDGIPAPAEQLPIDAEGGVQ